MFGAVLVDNCDDASLYSLIFFDTGGYLNGCGHGTLCSTAVWSRLHGIPETPYSVENPDGSTTIVEHVERKGEGGCRTTLLMPPAFVIGTDVSVDGADDARATLAYCGNHYLLLEASSVGMSPLVDKSTKEMRRMARNIRDTLGAEVGVRSADVTWEVMFYEQLRELEPTYSTAVVFSDQQLDRSPCGTGSCALLATLTEHSIIEAGQAVQTVGPTGERFELVRRPTANGDEEIRVELRGDAFITGVHEWLLDDGDPMAGGFQLE